MQAQHSMLVQLATATVQAGASDLHLTVGRAPTVRRDGTLVSFENVPVLTSDQVSEMIMTLLDDDQKLRACRAAKSAGADFVKTSTGFSSGGATVEDVALMRRAVGPALGVKASGGVRDADDAAAMIEAGATRIGASASVAIVAGERTSGGY